MKFSEAKELKVQAGPPKVCETKYCSMSAHYNKITPTSPLEKAKISQKCAEAKKVSSDAAGIFAKVATGKLTPLEGQKLADKQLKLTVQIHSKYKKYSTCDNSLESWGIPDILFYHMKCYQIFLDFFRLWISSEGMVIKGFILTGPNYFNWHFNRHWGKNVTIQVKDRLPRMQSAPIAEPAIIV